MLGAYHRLALPYALLGFVALVPWLLALGDAKRTSQALARTWLTTSGAVLLSFPWLVTAAEVYARLPSWAGWPLLALVAPVLQPQLLVAALARRRLGRSAGVCAWVLTEALFPKLLHDCLGHGLYPLTGFRPLAAAGTVAALSLVLLASNEWVASGFTRGRGWLRAIAAVASACAVGFLPLGARAGGGAPVRVAAIQASLPRYDLLLEQRGSEGLVDEVLSSHRALTLEAAAAGAELIVWGETVYPTTFSHPKSEEGRSTDEQLSALAREVRRPILFGGYDSDGATEFNAAFLLDAQGALRDVYRKSRLFPFGEFIPFGDVLVRWGLIQGPTGWGSGPGPRVLELALAGGRVIRVQPLICYEALFPEMTGAEAELLVNLSNDGGFGSALEARQDLVIAAFRSVETGRPQLRVANSGTSALIDGSGEILASLPVGARGVLSGALRPEPGHRAWPAWWLAVFGLIAVGARRLRSEWGRQVRAPVQTP